MLPPFPPKFITERKVSMRSVSLGCDEEEAPPVFSNFPNALALIDDGFIAAMFAIAIDRRCDDEFIGNG